MPRPGADGGWVAVGVSNLDRAWILVVDDSLTAVRNDLLHEDYAAAIEATTAGDRVVIVGFRGNGPDFLEAGPADTVGN